MYYMRGFIQSINQDRMNLCINIVLGCITQSLKHVTVTIFDGFRNHVFTEHYRRIQELAGAFKERTGTLLCRELLGLEGTGKDSFIPSDRTEAYYQSRPCKALVGLAAAILDAYLAEHSGGV